MGNQLASKTAKPGSHGEWHDWLQTTTVKDIKHAQLQKLVTVSADDNVKTVLQTLAGARLISAPVMDHSSFVDFIHLGEIAAELTIYWKDRVIPEVERLRHPGAPTHTLNKEAFFALNIREVIKHQQEKFIRATPETSLLTLASEMRANHVHRIAVCDSGTKAVVDVLTQSDIIQWLVEHRNQEWFAKHASVPVSSVVKDRKDLIKVQQSTTVVECFSILRKHAISSVPVVLDDGRLYSVLSPSILRGIVSTDAESLTKHIAQFLTERKEVVGAEVVVGTPEMTMLQALELMGKHRLHRLYIVNKYHVPTSVLSLTDVIAWMVAMEEAVHNKHAEKAEHKP